nr:MAG TPA: hypothetical protein [Caudoviricetes sp.]
MFSKCFPSITTQSGKRMTINAFDNPLISLWF